MAAGHGPSLSPQPPAAGQHGQPQQQQPPPAPHNLHQYTMPGSGAPPLSHSPMMEHSQRQMGLMQQPTGREPSPQLQAQHPQPALPYGGSGPMNQQQQQAVRSPVAQQVHFHATWVGFSTATLMIIRRTITLQ